MMCMRTYYRGYLSGTAVVKMTGWVPAPVQCFPSPVFRLPSSHFEEGVLTLPGLPRLLLFLLRPGSLVPGSPSHRLLRLVQPCSTWRSFGYTLATGCSTSWNSIKIWYCKNTLEKRATIPIMALKLFSSHWLTFACACSLDPAVLWA